MNCCRIRTLSFGISRKDPLDLYTNTINIYNIKGESMFDEDFDYITPDYDNEYEEPESWTLISALDRVLSVVLEERLSNNFWEKAKNPIDYLKNELDMTGIQVAIKG